MGINWVTEMVILKVTLKEKLKLMVITMVTVKAKH